MIKQKLMVYIILYIYNILAQKIQKDIEKELEKFQTFNTKYSVMLKKFPNPVTDEVKQK